MSGLEPDAIYDGLAEAPAMAEVLSSVLSSDGDGFLRRNLLELEGREKRSPIIRQVPVDHW